MFGEIVFCISLGFWGSAAAYAAAALLHEGGHALVGYFLGARCLWIRVGGVLWVPGGGIFVRKGGRTGRAGECALSCPDKKSCVAAALAGPAANLLSGILSGGYFLGKMKSFLAAHPVFWACVAAFSVCSLAMGVLNLWPGMAGWRGAGWGNNGKMAGSCSTGGGNDGKIAGKLWREEGFYDRLRRNQQRDVLRLEFGILEEMF